MDTHEPRNWKWMVPGLLIPITLLATAWLLTQPDDWLKTLSCLPTFATMILAVAMISNFNRYTQTWHVDLLRARQTALAITAENMMLEQAKGVHPETLRLLLTENRRALRLVQGSLSADQQSYSVLNADPAVTEYFITYFLLQSTDEKCMSKRVLSEGSKSFDPTGAVSDRDMYDRFVVVLLQQNKVTRPFGEYQPPYWINGWSPAAVAADLGWNWPPADQSDEKPAENVIPELKK